MADSVWTKIINRELPAEILYEDDVHIVILSIAPHNPGHTLVIPKDPQYANFWDMDSASYQKLLELSRKVARAIYVTFTPKRVGLVFEGFGVSDHVHVNLIPINQPGDLDHTSAKNATPNELAKVAKQLQPTITKEMSL